MFFLLIISYNHNLYTVYHPEPNAAWAGGQVTPIHASPDTTIGEFKGLVLQTLRPDDDELTRKVSVVELILGETPLPEDSDSLTLQERGVSPDAAVLAIISKRSVECLRKEDGPYDLHVPERAVMLKIPDGTTAIGDFVFVECESLAGVTIRNSVTRIGTAAFTSCRSLLNLTIPESVETIEARRRFGACLACLESFDRNAVDVSSQEVVYKHARWCHGCDGTGFSRPALVRTWFNSSTERCKDRQTRAVEMSAEKGKHLDALQATRFSVERSKSL